MWMNKIPFRGMWEACMSVWVASSFPGCRAPLPWPLEFLRKVWRGSNWKWRRAFEGILWPRQSIKFLQ